MSIKPALSYIDALNRNERHHWLSVAVRIWTTSLQVNQDSITLKAHFLWSKRMQKLQKKIAIGWIQEEHRTTDGVLKNCTHQMDLTKFWEVQNSSLSTSSFPKCISLSSKFTSNTSPDSAQLVFACPCVHISISVCQLNNLNEPLWNCTVWWQNCWAAAETEWKQILIW